jgi:hypothetical protein
MRELLFKHEDDAVKAQVKLRMPSFSERWQIIESCGFKLDSNGEVSAGLEQASSMRRMVEASKDYYIEATVEKKSKDKEKVVYKTYDELVYDPECDAVLIGAAGLLLNGGKPSKK